MKAYINAAINAGVKAGVHAGALSKLPSDRIEEEDSANYLQFEENTNLIIISED